MTEDAITTVEITVAPATSGPHVQRTNEPVTVGVPLPKGKTKPSQAWTVVDEAGRTQPVQTRVLETWADGTVRWLLVDFSATVRNGTAAYRLSSRAPERPTAGPVLVTRADGNGIEVDTGAALFVARTGSAFPLQAITVAGASVIRGAETVLRIRPEDNAECTVLFETARIEEAGPLRTALYFEGVASRGGRSFVKLALRAHFFAGSATVRFVLTVLNDRRASHPGGYWDLGDAGSVYFRDISLTIVPDAWAERPAIRAAVEADSPPIEVRDSLAVYQDSSGGANWQSSNHVNREGRVPNRFRGYEVRGEDAIRRGHRAEPIVTIGSGSQQLSVALPQFWQNFPKKIAVSAESISLSLWPEDYGDVYELQGGEQKSHTFYVAFAPDMVTAEPLAWCRDPLIGAAPPSWYCTCTVMPYVSPRSDGGPDTYESLIDAAVDGQNSFEAKRETIDEYGWRNFGDVYGDHEAAFEPGPPPLVSHYNNQYDAIAGAAIQFFRTGDRRWWLMMRDLAAHVIDVDIYHTRKDKAAYNEGLFWHTSHYVDVATATHRTYARAKNTGGGGPSAEHNYTTGLMLHYFLTGNVSSRQTAVGLARWVVAMDDGKRTPFRWLHGGPTGHATGSGSWLYHGPGRAAGNSLNALIDGHRLAPNEGFLFKAEEIIRRVIHPVDDIAARDLLDIERKWFYTIFLQALGKYLAFKAETDEVDRSYSYARASLLHYARWMAEHEYPYLEKPEHLEFPTESWAAQEMRKSEVFDIAALHTSGDEARALRDRAVFFWNYSVTKLSEFPSRSRTRPVVIMMTNGFRRQFFAERPGLRAPSGQADVDFGVPVAFYPQKFYARRRLVALAIGVAALLLVSFSLVVWWVLR